MYIVLAEYQVKPGQLQEFAAKIVEQKIAEKFREQPGNIRFEYSLPLNGTDVLKLVDVWETIDDFNKHLNCNVTPLWGALKDEYVVSSKSEKYTVC